MRPEQESITLLERVMFLTQFLQELECDLRAGKNWDLIEDYRKKRIELVGLTPAIHGFSWCTLCAKILPLRETEFIFLEGSKRVPLGRRFISFDIDDVPYLHRTCAACRKEAYSQSEDKETYDTTLKSIPSFHAFYVEKREHDYYACKFTKWVILPKNKCDLGAIPSSLIEQIARRWNLPHRIELNIGLKSPKNRDRDHEYKLTITLYAQKPYLR